MGGDEIPELQLVVQNALDVLNFLPQALHLGHTVEDVLPVQVPELDLCNVGGLYLVDGKALHQGGDHLILLLRFTDDADGLVNVQQNLGQSLQQVQLFLLLSQVKGQLPAYAPGAEADPLLENIRHAQLLWHRINEHIEIALEAVLQGGQLEQAGHQLFRIRPPPQIQCQLESGQVDLIPHIRDLLDLPGLDKVGDLVHDLLNGGGVGDLQDIDAVGLLVVAVA